MIPFTKIQRSLSANSVYTYPEICDLLKEEMKNGTNSKNAQFKVWRQFFDFRIEDGFIIVTEIYTRKRDKENDGRSKGNHKKYIDDIEILISDYLVTKKNWSQDLTAANIYWLLGMVNDIYKDRRFQYDIKWASKKDVDGFLDRANRKLYRIITSAFEVMQRSGKISYKKIIFVEESKNSKVVIRLASILETAKIESIKDEVLFEMNFDNESQVFLYRKETEFYDRVNSMLDTELELRRSFPGFRLTYYPDRRYLKEKEQIIINESLITPDVRASIQQSLNDKIIKAVNQDAYAKYKSNIAKKEAGEAAAIGTIRYKGFIYKEDYVEKQIKLADYYLKK